MPTPHCPQSTGLASRGAAGSVCLYTPHWATSSLGQGLWLLPPQLRPGQLAVGPGDAFETNKLFIPLHAHVRGEPNHRFLSPSPHTHAHTCARMHTQTAHACMRTHTDICTCIHTRAGAYRCAHTHRIRNWPSAIPGKLITRMGQMNIIS